MLTILAPTLRARDLQLTTPSAPRCQVFGRVAAATTTLESVSEIELIGETSRQKTKLVNGTFEFKGVTPGAYQFRALGRLGAILIRRTEQLTGTGDHIILRFPISKADPVVRNVISFRQLRHKLDKRAVKAFHEGEKAAELGDLPKSVQCFQKAASLDPQFPNAEQNLAVQLALLGREEEALQHARAAYDIDPNFAEAGHTLATLLVWTKKYADAERVLRLMLQTQQQSPELNGWLAVSLIGQLRTEEGLECLRSSAAEWPIMRLLAANVLIEAGQLHLALVQVQNFMRSASECERRELEQWIAGIGSERATTVSGR